MAVTVPDKPLQLVVIVGLGSAATVTVMESDAGDLLPDADIVRTDIVCDVPTDHAGVKV